MTTRRVDAGTRRSQNGWASAPEFENLRGLSGSAVAFKAALVDDPKKRALLYFLQAHSLKPGGIKRIARELMEMFPDRIASATMYKIGCRPGKKLAQKEQDNIAAELDLDSDEKEDEFLDAVLDRPAEVKPRHQYSTEDFLSECLERAERGLEEFIERICCDPRIAITDDWGELSRYEREVRPQLNDYEDKPHREPSFDCSKLDYFHDVLGSLFEYQQRYEQSIRDGFVETSIGTKVFEAVNYALETGRSALIEGSSGWGKSTALRAWCEMHLGQARFVQLKGITNRTGFFREIARALGLPHGTALSASKVQMRVEEFLQRTKIMLVLDESQYLFAAGNRVHTPPELVCWLLTACYNEGVPFTLSATSEFTARRAIVEKNTTWQSEQLRRRIRRHFDLASPTKDDLFRVAEKLLPGLGRAAIEYVVGYSLISKMFFQGITDSIEDAQLIASRAGRKEIRFADLKAAIQEWRSPSDAALQRVFENKPAHQRGRRASEPARAEPDENLAAGNDGLNRLTTPVTSVAARQNLMATV